jgi:stage IV sporulation protein FB
MLQGGYFQLGRWRGVPIRIHVLTPLGALLFTGFRFAPGAWVGFLLLVLLHEMGHALLVMRYRLRVSSIDLHAYGGICHWSGQATEWERSVIAWGGVIAQVALLAVTVGTVVVVGLPRTMFVRELIEVFTRTNLWLMLINLAPFRPLDGAEAWKIVGAFRRRWASGPAFGPSGRSVTSPFETSRPSSRRPGKLSPDEARRIANAFEDAVRKRP